MPNRTRATSVRPAPTRPANPTISPARTEKLTSSELAGPGQAVDLEEDVADRRLDLREQRDGPADHVPDEVGGRELARSAVGDRRGGRRGSTVARSHSSKTSSRRWLTNRIATPRSRSRRTIVNSRSTSWADSDAVGSSRIRTRASTDSDLAISISCWSAIDRPRTGAPDVELDVELLEQRLRRRAASRPSRWCRTGPDGAWPMKTFSATRQVREEAAAPGGRPRCRAPARAPGPLDPVGTPSSRDRARCPAGGSPARILTSVLLPAPFSPTSAWISPAQQLERDVVERLGRAELLRDAAAARRAARAARPSASGASADGHRRGADRRPAPVRPAGAARAADQPDVDAARGAARRPSRPAPRRR